MKNNMDLWNSVEKTDPSHTKKVNQRGGFTAIDAQYQVMNATAKFGPIGMGWGYSTTSDIVKVDDENTVIIINVVFWWLDPDNPEAGAHSFGPVPGCSNLVSKGRVDNDAPKKAMTDGLTKALSHLGFNADVFLGKFDDNKYVNERRQEEQREERKAAEENDPIPSPGELKDKVDSFSKSLIMIANDKTAKEVDDFIKQHGAKLMSYCVRAENKVLVDELKTVAKEAREIANT